MPHISICSCVKAMLGSYQAKGKNEERKKKSEIVKDLAINLGIMM